MSALSRGPMPKRAGTSIDWIKPGKRSCSSSAERPTSPRAIVGRLWRTRGDCHKNSALRRTGLSSSRPRLRRATTKPTELSSGYIRCTPRYKIVFCRRTRAGRPVGNGCANGAREAKGLSAARASSLRHRILFAGLHRCYVHHGKRSSAIAASSRRNTGNPSPLRRHPHHASGLIHSDDSQTARSSSSSRYESRNCRQGHTCGSPSA
jgi:hypothetical protein